jgi:hypothetical protein
MTKTTQINQNNADCFVKSIELYVDPNGDVKIELYGGKKNQYYCNLLREAVSLFDLTDEDIRGGYKDFPELDHGHLFETDK